MATTPTTLIDDALGHARRTPRRRLGGGLTAITVIASLTGQAERCLPELVTSAQLNGHTREQIAHPLATSPAEARLYCGPGSPIADGR